MSIRLVTRTIGKILLDGGAGGLEVAEFQGGIQAADRIHRLTHKVFVPHIDELPSAGTRGVQL